MAAAGEEYIGRARQRAGLIEQRANVRIQEMADQAERDAIELMGRARRRAQELFDETRRSCEAIVAEARIDQDTAAAELTTRRAELRLVEEDIDSARAELIALDDATAAIAGMANDVLRRFGGSPDEELAAPRRRDISGSARRRALRSVTPEHEARRPS